MLRCQILNVQQDMIFKKIYLKHQTQPETNYTWVKDVKWDSSSKDPHFIDYNTMRKKIKLANRKGLKKIVDRMSVATHHRLERDGYTIRMATEDEKIPQPDGFDLNQVVEWKKIMPSRESRLEEEQQLKMKIQWRSKHVNRGDILKYLNILTNEMEIETNNIKLIPIDTHNVTIFYHGKEIK